MSILILKKSAYILNFWLNFISLACFKDKIYKQFYWWDKIYNKKISQIIGLISWQIIKLQDFVYKEYKSKNM